MVIVADRDSHARLAVTLLAWLWAGLVLGVSFVATPVKFLAPSLSLADALAVGRVTFEALKWIECVAVVALAATIWIANRRRRELALFAVIVVILLCQYIWMLPVLDARVQTIIDGQDPAAVVPALGLHGAGVREGSGAGRYRADRLSGKREC